MKDYPKEFHDAVEVLERAREQLHEAEARLQDVCPHVYLDGKSAIRPSITHSECSLCEMSTYDMGRSEK